ncbi:SDR family oxidoreductase [Rhizobium pusense]|uniref:SDR family oxidoreductase n=1 Tax=Agrobacterium pusense TaxID=648995 RepID=UPI00244922AF|nr:SDR family oxidoreductase [Agrobacterium pusense]MDH2091663.1 SDR family oxidoreductase [Agrobacterium pusense]
MNQIQASFSLPVWSNLQGARILIVGGGSGIGLGGAQLLAALGCEVILAGRNAERLNAAVGAISGKASSEVVDGQSIASIKEMFARVGAFDHLIITMTGRLGGGTFAEVDLGEFRQAFEEKFWPHLIIAQASLATLSSTGSITFVTGAAARKVSAGGSGFAAINGALEIMTPTLARELAPRRVNAVSPGFVATPWYDHISQAEFDAAEAFAAARLPVGRIGRASDVAQALLYVVANGFVTGSVIECDGGARVSNDTPETGLPK